MVVEDRLPAKDRRLTDLLDITETIDLGPVDPVVVVRHPAILTENQYQDKRTALRPIT